MNARMQIMIKQNYHTYQTMLFQSKPQVGFEKMYNFNYFSKQSYMTQLEFPDRQKGSNQKNVS